MIKRSILSSYNYCNVMNRSSRSVCVIKTYCPSIDILGVNTYGGVQHLDVVRMYGWDSHTWLLSKMT